MRYPHRFLAVLLAFVATFANQPAVSATPPTESYVFEFANTHWVVETERPRHPIVYRVWARRYENLQTGEVILWMDATRYKCNRDADGSMECGGGPSRFKTVQGHPQTFDVADDLSSARLSFKSDRGLVELNWEPLEMTDPASYAPGTAQYSVSCPEGSGEGMGLYRSMKTEGRTLDMSSQDVDDAYGGISREVLNSDCPPPPGF